jgi:hypothetical protein
MLLRERDISLADIGRSLGRDLSLISRVNNGQRRSQTVEREIARRLDLSEQEAFPEWHDRRRRKTPRKNAKR